MALLKFKRSAVPAKIPSIADLDLGELAINTYDGKVYTKKDDGTQAIVEVGGGGGVQTITSSDGSVTVTGTTDINLSVPVTAATNTVILPVRNNTGATLAKGTAVYINGALGQNPTVTKAIATGDATSAQTLGLVTADINNNSVGNVTLIGTLTNVDTSAFSDGQQLYLSPTTAGALTATKPYAPSHLVYMAVVEHAHPALGKLFVKVQNGYEMDELHNVAAQSPANNDGLFYNTSTSLWEKKSIATALGYTPANKAGDTFTGSVTIPELFVSDNTPTFTSSAFQYHLHQSPHIAYVKQTGGYSWYWRRNSTGTLSGTDEVEDMSLTEGGSLFVRSSVHAPIFYDTPNTAYFVDPSSTSNLVGLTVANTITGSISGNAATVSSITNLTNLGKNSLIAGVVDGLTTTNFRTTMFGNAVSTYNIVTSRWNNVPTAFSGLGPYGTAIAWSGSDTHAFLALNYNSAGAKIGGGSGDNINWSADLLHSANYTSYAMPSGSSATNSVDVRAPIFYDTPNTGYYLDPSSGSRMGSITLDSGNVLGAAVTFNSMNTPHGDYTDFNLVGDFGFRYLQAATNGPAISGATQYYGMTLGLGNNYGFDLYASQFYWPRTALGGLPYPSVRYRENGAWGSWTKIYAGWADAPSGSTFAATGDFRAPIFYDSNNTGFFIDAASTSSLITLLGQNLGVYDSGVANDPYGKIAVTRTADANNYSYYGLTRSGQLGAGFGIDTINRFWWGSATAGYAGVASAIGMTLSMGGTLSVTADVRAPIFYDSNDTAYYVDPTGSSLVNQVYYAGLYNSADGNYGIVGANGFFDTVNSGVDADALELCYVRGSEVRIGTGGGNKAIRASIFYEGTDTAYYLDPNGGTSLRTVGDWRSDSGDWTGEFSGKIQYHNSSWYLQGANAWIFRDSAGGEPFRVSQAGSVTANADMRAPIFYDNNNTGYYVDPAGDTNLNKTFTYLGGKDTNGNWNTGFQNTPPASYNFHGDISSGGPSGTWWFYESMRHSNASNYWGTQIAWGWEDNGNRLQQRNVSNGSFGGWVEYLNTSGRTYSGGLEMTGIIQSTADIRAPLYYDRNDTSYYVNPNGESVLSTLTVFGELNLSAGTTYVDHSGTIVFRNQANYVNSATLTTGGDFTASGNVTAYSDIRIKDNVETIPNALDKLDFIRGVTYTRTDRDDKERRYAGVIAQEIERVLPEAIFENEEYKSVDYNATIGLLIQAIKELRDEVEALKNRS